MATAAILKSFLKILEALDCLAEDQSQKEALEEKQIILQIRCKS